jgi:DNA mismatch repair protein MutL
VSRPSRIRRLPEHLIDKIAAGEVVERVGSVVKELVENALDADARDVTVELRDAGRQRIRVRDDGLGMTAEELGWALTRHATSKIAEETDLDAVATLGFRGEALPAICAVSRFALLSCPRGERSGTLVRGEGGTVLETVGVEAPAGTTVDIEDLFFNTPARLKFLKGARAEQAQALRHVQALALSRPDVRFTVAGDGRPVLTAPAVRSLRDRMGALYGFELAGALLDVAGEGQGVRIEGLVGPPAMARGNRDEIGFLVNGRPVRDTLLVQTLLDAYRPLLPRDRFPVAVLRLELPPGEVDVNVHPTKAWVRFRAPRLVQELLFVAVQAALRQAPAAVQGGLGPAAPAPVAEPGTATAPGCQPALFREAPAAFGAGTAEAASRGPGRFGRVVGQLEETFVVAADVQEVFFIDQHVAHERVLFERLLAQVADAPLPAQERLFPEPVALAPGQAERLAEHAPLLARLGFDVESFGGGEVLVRATPVLLQGRSPQRLIERLLDELAAPGPLAVRPVLERALAFVACRAAIKAPAALGPEEMQRLIDDLGATASPYFCPHGRPVVSRLPLADIRKELRRLW